MKFRATVELGGKTATGIHVPAEVVERLGRGKRPPVRVRINGYTYRSTVAVMGGRFMLVPAEARVGAGVTAGERVDIDVELDTAPREVVVADRPHRLPSILRATCCRRGDVRRDVVWR